MAAQVDAVGAEEEVQVDVAAGEVVLVGVADDEEVLADAGGDLGEPHEVVVGAVNALGSRVHLAVGNFLVVQEAECCLLVDIVGWRVMGWVVVDLLASTCWRD